MGKGTSSTGGATRTSKAATSWVPIHLPMCDICFKPAKWRHPKGGERCGRCPRPELP